MIKNSISLGGFFTKNIHIVSHKMSNLPFNKISKACGQCILGQ